ncbi:MAG: PAS domain S-box protein [bacterium]|nr:PAS domain S-box protein [bacterium]
MMQLNEKKINRDHDNNGCFAGNSQAAGGTEEKLKESDRRYKELLEQLPEVISEIDLKGNLKFANHAAYEKFGYSQEDFKSKFRVMDLFHPDDYDRLKGNIKRLLAGENIPPNEYKVVTKGGTVIPLQIHSAVITKNGKPVGIRSIGIDVSRRQKVESLLRESESKYRFIFNHSPIGIAHFDEHTNVLACNDKILEILGITKEQALNFNLLERYTNKKLIAAVKDSLMGKLGNYEGKYTTVQGKKNIYIRVIFKSVFSEEGVFLGGVEIIQDFTERYKMEEEIQKVQKLESIGILAGGIAHDYNNMLTAIMGNLSMAQFISKPNAQTSFFLEEAGKAARKAKLLTEQLLTFSTEGEPLKQTIAIEKLIEGTAEFVLSGSTITCKTYFQGDLDNIAADKSQVIQLIRNIILNSLQAMPHGGQMAIAGKNVVFDGKNGLSLPPGKYIEISIKDSGTGIATENISKLFDPFFTTREKGKGLGLSIAYSISKRHAGTITAHSKLGEGAEFRIYFPSLKEEISKEPLAPVRKIAKKRTGHILFMDDELSVRLVAEEMLLRINFDPVMASDGLEAVELYENAFKEGNPFDIVIMDLTVPSGMDGKEAMPKLLAIAPDVRVIVSSGYSNDPVMASYKEYGFCGILPKPYDINELKQALDKYITTGPN